MELKLRELESIIIHTYHPDPQLRHQVNLPPRVTKDRDILLPLSFRRQRVRFTYFCDMMEDLGTAFIS